MKKIITIFISFLLLLIGCRKLEEDKKNQTQKTNTETSATTVEIVIQGVPLSDQIGVDAKEERNGYYYTVSSIKTAYKKEGKIFLELKEQAVGKKYCFVLIDNSKESKEISEKVCGKIIRGKNLFILTYEPPKYNPPVSNPPKPNPPANNPPANNPPANNPPTYDPPTPSVYTAIVRVSKNNASVANQKVYIAPYSYSSFESLEDLAEETKFKLEKSQAFGLHRNDYGRIVEFAERNYQKATTNAEGIVVFENLRGSKNYIFMVAIKDYPYFRYVTKNVTATGTISLSLGKDDRPAEGQLPIKTEIKVPVGVIFASEGESTKHLDYRDVTLFLNGSKAKLVSVYLEEKGEWIPSHFEGYVNEDTEVNYVVMTSCGDRVEGSVQSLGPSLKLDKNPYKRTLVLDNRSSNPYIVTIGEDEAYVVKGESTKTITIFGDRADEKIKVSWKQDSGYVLYPTKGSEEVTYNCANKKRTVVFPKEKI